LKSKNGKLSRLQSENDEPRRRSRELEEALLQKIGELIELRNAVIRRTRAR
jgi:hypothetical protein